MTSWPDRMQGNRNGGNCKRVDGSATRGGNATKGVSGDVATTVTKSNKGAHKEGRQMRFDDMKGKRHRCLEPCHWWFNCKAHITLTGKSQKDSTDVMCCLVIGMLGKSGTVREVMESDSIRRVLRSGLLTAVHIFT